MRLLISSVLFLSLCLTAGCREETPGADTTAPQVAENAADAGPTAAAPFRESGREENASLAGAERTPPGPPVLENFQGSPQIRLFPWVGDSRPAEEDNHLHEWSTLIDQLVKGTGLAEDQTTGNRGWIFSSLVDSDSSGYFAPLSVAPQTTYQVSFKLSADLPQGASAGIRISEFDEFLWIGGQYTESQHKMHFLGTREGKRLTGKVSGQQSFTFTTGPDTQMIHLVLFRDGVQDGNSVMFDDIQVTAPADN